MKIKIGLIGPGNVGKEHLKSCLRNPNVELIACCCKTEETANKINNKYGIKTFIDYEEFFKLKLEGIIIASPTKLHKKFAELATNKKINLLIEKPLCESEEEIQSLIKKIKKEKITAVVCHDFLYSNAMIFIQEYIKKNNIKIKKIWINKQGKDFISKSNKRINISDMNEVFNSLYHLAYILVNFCKTPLKNIETTSLNSKINEIQIKSKILFEDGKICEINLDKSGYHPKKFEILFETDDAKLKLDLNKNSETIIKIKENSSNIIYHSTNLGNRENILSEFIDKIKMRSNDQTSCQISLHAFNISSRMINAYSQKENQIVKKINLRKPAYLQITRKCNNNCVFCSNPQFETELNMETIEKTLEKYKKKNITEVFITGGEPTTHPNLFEIIKLIKDNHMNPRMITNGIKLSEESFSKKIISAGLDSINLSMHTHLDELSEKMHGDPKVVSQQKKALYILDKTSLPVFINTTINSLNFKHLLEFVSYIHMNFKKFKHIVFNFLDPGFSDGINLNNAGKNPWIVPAYTNIELPLNQTLSFLKSKNITFRVERVPLCYMSSFEEYSSETRKIVKEQNYTCAFARQQNKNIIRIVSPKELKEKSENCKICQLNNICAGIQKEYITLHGDKELYPVFINENKIINKIK